MWLSVVLGGLSCHFPCVLDGHGDLEVSQLFVYAHILTAAQTSTCPSGVPGLQFPGVSEASSSGLPPGVSI